MATMCDSPNCLGSTHTAPLIIDGMAHAADIRLGIRERLAVHDGVRPGLAVIAIGEDPASAIYAEIKRNACAEVGINFSYYPLPHNTVQEDVLHLVDKLNRDSATHGILVQRPLPAHICKHTIAKAVLPSKDVDCLHPYNMGKLMLGSANFVPCTPGGIVNLLKRENIEIVGKHAVVIGRSDIVGKPMAAMFANENATVTLCHSYTRDLAEICHGSDILVAAVGRPGFITAEYVKPGATVIDVGINRNYETGEVVGDVDFENVAKIAGYITPVPGGVGPMTVATLLQNTLLAAICPTD